MLLLLSGCGDGVDDPPPGALTASQEQELNDAAAALDANAALAEDAAPDGNAVTDGAVADDGTAQPDDVTPDQ